MKTVTSTQNQLQSKIVLGVALLTAACAISLSFQPASHANTVPFAYAAAAPVEQVVIEAKRMSADEKLAYDSVSQQVARVEIVGKRLTAAEKLAIDRENALAAIHHADHGKA